MSREVWYVLVSCTNAQSQLADFNLNIYLWAYVSYNSFTGEIVTVNKAV